MRNLQALMLMMAAAIGAQPDPVFMPWGHRPPQPHRSRRPDDAEAIAAAEAKRARKAKKRLGQ